jgi:osmoprotectant transport system substrate-binding protein
MAADPLPDPAAPTILTARLPVAVVSALSALALGACSSSTKTPTTTTSSVSGAATTSTTTTTTTTTTSKPGTGKPPVIIGDKNYTEQFVLGELYLEALQAQGFSVTIDQNIGPLPVAIKGLQTGTFSMYPEYLNVWNSQVAGYRRRFKTVASAYRAARDYALEHGMELLDPTPFSDTSGIGVTEAFAHQNHLRTIGSLADVASTLTLGGPPQFQQDSLSGLPAMEEVYGFAPAAYKPLNLGDQYTALDQGTVQAAYVNTTDGEFTTGDYALLTDTRKVFGIGNVVPVLTTKILDEEGPVFAATINRVSALLTMRVIRELNAEVDPAEAGKSAAGVASRFLADHGVIPPSSVNTS